MRVALDAKVLQSTEDHWLEARLRVTELAAAFHRSGRLAGTLVSPEFPAPELEGPLVWDCLPEVRKLVAPGDVAYLVPEPFYLISPGAPAAQAVVEHWALMGVTRVVYLADLQLVISMDRSELAGALAERLRARMDWVSTADLILTSSDDVARQARRLFGNRRGAVVTVGDGSEGWDVVVERTIAAVGVLPAPQPRRPPKRLAIVGPFPPHGGGIGAYNAAFVAAASGIAGVDAITIACTPWSPPAAAGKAHIESFGRDVRPTSYDAVVYTLGNSDGHLPSIETALRHAGWLWMHETRLPAVATSTLAALDDEGFWARFSSLLELSYPGRAPLAGARAAGRDHLALARAGVGLTRPLVARSAGVLVNSMAARHSLLLDLVPEGWHPPVHVVPPACPPVRPRERPLATGPHALVGAFGVVSMSKRPDLLVDAAARTGCRLAFVGPCPPVLAQLIRERAQVRGNEDRVEVTGSVSDDEWWEWMQRATLAVQLREHSSGELSAALLDALAAGLPVLTNLPAAADYPDGTVARLEDVRPDTLAERIDNLLSSPSLLEGYSRQGQQFAAGHHMKHLSDTVLSLVTDGQV